MDTITDPQVVNAASTGGMSVNEAAQANLETAVHLLCKEALVQAIQDKRLHRGHLRVLAVIAMCMSTAAKAWPGRAVIASLLNMPLKTVSNLLFELRGFGYLIASRQEVEEANNRRLTVYTWGKIDHETIRREITKFVEAVRRGESPAPAGTSRPDGNSEVPPQRELPAPTGTKSPAPTGKTAQKSRPSGHSIDNNNIPPEAGEGADATPSRKREVKNNRTRLKEDWTPAPKTIAWVHENFHASSADIAREAAKFRDHHLSKGSAMADWPAAWRTWWNMGFHKLPRRTSAMPNLFQASPAPADADFDDAFERARIADEQARCQR